MSLSRLQHTDMTWPLSLCCSFGNTRALLVFQRVCRLWHKASHTRLARESCLVAVNHATTATTTTTSLVPDAARKLASRVRVDPIMRATEVDGIAERLASIPFLQHLFVERGPMWCQPGGIRSVLLVPEIAVRLRTLRISDPVSWKYRLDFAEQLCLVLPMLDELDLGDVQSDGASEDVWVASIDAPQIKRLRLRYTLALKWTQCAHVRDLHITHVGPMTQALIEKLPVCPSLQTVRWTNVVGVSLLLFDELRLLPFRAAGGRRAECYRLKDNDAEWKAQRIVHNFIHRYDDKLRILEVCRMTHLVCLHLFLPTHTFHEGISLVLGRLRNLERLIVRHDGCIGHHWDANAIMLSSVGASRLVEFRLKNENGRPFHRDGCIVTLDAILDWCIQADTALAGFALQDLACGQIHAFHFHLLRALFPALRYHTPGYAVPALTPIQNEVVGDVVTYLQTYKLAVTVGTRDRIAAAFPTLPRNMAGGIFNL